MSELYEDVYTSWFSFGKNREDFLKKITPQQIEDATTYVSNFLGKQVVVAGKTVVDVGCGSGIMSLAFLQLGAKKVLSIDIDDTSIACAQHVKQQFGISDDRWEIKKCSVLNKESIAHFGTFDIVYSWWVIHHSGDMWRGLENLFALTHWHTYLYLALYNTCTRWIEWTSAFWHAVKSVYSKYHRTRYIIKPLYTAYLLLWLIATGRNPITYIRGYKSFRGMDFFTDIEDRLGGYPYEYAHFDEIVDYYQKKWYTLLDGIRVRSIGCNEFLFQKKE